MSSTSGQRVRSGGLLALCAAVSMMLCGSTAALAASTTPSGFGFASEGSGNGEGGFNGLSLNSPTEADMAAGSHPHELALTFALNVKKGPKEEVLDSAGGELKDLTLSFPAGLILNNNPVVRCFRLQLDEGDCPPESRVGEVTLDIATGAAPREETSTLYNMVPPVGGTAELGFRVAGVDVIGYTSVRTSALSAGEAGIDLNIFDLPSEKVIGGRIMLFGVYFVTGIYGEGGQDRAFLSLPTACGSPLSFGARADTWQDEGASAEASFNSHTTAAEGNQEVGINSCDQLAFEPKVVISANTKDAETAAQLTVDVRAGQEGLLQAGQLGEADIEKATVVLPEGLALDPNRASGLTVCASQQTGIGTEGPPSCPATSEVGTVQISTPMLPNPLEGGVYALPSQPPEIKLLIAGSGDGVNLKMLGEVVLNEETGRVTLVLPQAPLLPISELRLSLSGGAQGALVTPAKCGVYTASSDFTPWATPALSDVVETSGIEIADGPEGSPCVSPLPFTPTFTAGSNIDGAGSFASFSMLLQRSDDQQRLSSLQFKAPDGVEAMLSSVATCEEPHVANQECTSASQIGHAVLGAGPGGYPLVLPGSEGHEIPIYLTGPYEGAPYGLAIVVPFEAGPYNLGTKLLRARIEVDPHTAQWTITTDPLPSIVKGIPLDLRTVYAVIDRPGFMFNPTDCSPMSSQGSAVSLEGASAPVSTPFEVGSCQSLQFTPTLTLTTSAKSSAQEGDSLNAKITFPASRQENVLATTQANLQSVRIQLPKQLSSRLTTLQQACKIETFQANPAGCSAASLVGHASAATPMLSTPLTGPAYLVSHAGEAYPSIVVALQGAGLTIDLEATTLISSSSVTTSTFTALPDVPISSFELNLPAGPNSALAANGNLCDGLSAPTEMVAQNGAVINQATKLTVSGCPKTKVIKPKHKKKHAKKRHAKRKRAKKSTRATKSRAAKRSERRRKK